MRLKLFMVAFMFMPMVSHSTDSDVPVDDLNNLVSIYNKIKSDYVGEVNNSDLIKSAIRGMVESLDQNSKYLVGSDVDNINKSMSGSFSGIGVELITTEDGLLVISPLDGGPAYRSGIVSGDIITSVNNISAKNKKTVASAISSLGGDEDRKVDVVVQRGDDSIEFSLVKEIVSIKPIKSTKIDGKYAVMKINTFSRGTFIDFKADIESMNRNGKVEGLIIDLRGNSGGLVDEAVDIADYLIDRNKVLLITERKFDTLTTISRMDNMFNKPIVVIIDKGSASASEILAGAIQDNGAGLIVGENSFGKGTIQSVSDYENGDVLVITTATYLTPNGNIIQSNGVKPDIEIEGVDLIKTSKKRKRFKPTIAADHYMVRSISELKSLISDGL